MSRQLTIGGLLVVCGLYFGYLSAQESHRHGDQSHLISGVDPLARPIVGQAQFSAIKQAVWQLQNDPSTDWSTVDIDRFRDRLMDLDKVMTQTQVVRRALPNGAEFVVRSPAEALPAVRNIVLAHSRELDRLPDVFAVAQVLGESVRLTVTSDDPQAATRIHALGFYGLLTVGSDRWLQGEN